MTLCCCLETNGKTSNQHVEMPTQIKFIHGTSQESPLIQTQKSRKYDVKCNNNNNNNNNKEGLQRRYSKEEKSKYIIILQKNVNVVGENKEQDMT